MRLSSNTVKFSWSVDLSHCLPVPSQITLPIHSDPSVKAAPWPSLTEAGLDVPTKRSQSALSSLLPSTPQPWPLA